ncbi:outer membrane lipid asymmetry maintenance protein MlaD [Ruminobacter sp. RM87]|uniref:outer membrane lipid asymmetry maintenance protein MlaD n=1 Tax=Ruminobacter sp. RM87 TaxID=1200567 RepID=UPI000690D19F|nr:outer membrane lipid asymmetry maintenance protein MlaD [Ruminobacter sp. RM87]
MKFSKIEFAVGCFIVAAIFCGVMLALKVAGLSFDFKDDSYRVYGYFDNVGSLKLRAPVKIGGVVIGRVSEIHVDPEKLVPVVEMEIQQKYNTLSSESKASILTAGLIGEQYIGITPGFYDEDMGTTYLQDGDRINDTGSAIVLEDLIGKFLYSVNKSDSSSSESGGVAQAAEASNEQ